MKVLRKIHFDKKSQILDIGCGDGVITKEIVIIVSDGCVIGTDVSSEMVDFASKEHKAQTNLRFLQMDASDNIFRQQFDIITSFNCLHWVKDQQQALNGIASAALPGAQIALLLSHKKSLYHHVFDKICSSAKWKEFFLDFENPRAFFESDAYKDMLVETGLEVLELSEEEMTYTFHSITQLKGFLRAAGSQIKLIPNPRKEEFLDDFAMEFLRHIDDIGGDSIPVSFWCLNVIARKNSPKPTISNDKDVTATSLSLFARL